MLNSLLANLSPTNVLLAVVALVVVAVIKSLYTSLRSSGPWGLPWFGYYPFLRKDFPTKLLELSKKYGDAYVITIAGRQYLHLSSIKALREAFVTKADCFGGRSQEFSIFYLLFKDGILMTDDECWRVWRKFVGQAMRELGIGPGEKLKGPLLDSLQEVLDTLAKSNGEPVDFYKLMSVQCVEIVRRLFLGSNVSNEDALKITKMYATSVNSMIDVGILLHGAIAKWLLLPRRPGYQESCKSRQEMETALYKTLEDHKAKFDPQHCEDFVDIYLREKEIRSKKNDPQAKYYTDEAFISTLLLVYGDGSLSIAAIVLMYLRKLAPMLDVQNSIYEEIVAEIGTNRPITYDDRSKLPYLFSVMKELERMLEFITVMASIVAKRDTVVSGNFVPKGAITLMNVKAMHNDPKTFEDPSRFNPKRFMSDDKTVRSKADMPVLFSLGKRACAGESLAMTEIFMFVASIIQQYTLHPIEETRKDLVTRNSAESEILTCRLIAKPRDHPS